MPFTLIFISLKQVCSSFLISSTAPFYLKDRNKSDTQGSAFPNLNISSGVPKRKKQAAKPPFARYTYDFIVYIDME
jgi:hypothetical protein